MIKPGDYLLITDGEYSSYSVICLCRVAASFDPKDILARYRAALGPTHPDRAATGYINPDTFASWLTSVSGLAGEIDFHEIRVSDLLH